MDQSPIPQIPGQNQNQPAVAPWLLIIFIIVLLAGGGYLGWYFYNQSKTKPVAPAPTVTTPTTTPVSATATSTANWAAYSNTKYNYSLKYPTGWYVYGYKTGDEATTDTANIAMKNAQSQSHYIKVSTGNNAEMETIITNLANKTGYQTSATTLGGQAATQYIWTEVLNGQNVSINKLVKTVKGDYTYYLFGITTDYNKTATVDQGNFTQILSTFQFTTTAATPTTAPAASSTTL